MIVSEIISSCNIATGMLIFLCLV